jgi:ATP-dependent helicase/DNAse subunit B
MAATLHLLQVSTPGTLPEPLLERCGKESARPGAVLWLAPTRRALDDVRRALIHAGVRGLLPALWTFEDSAAALLRVEQPSTRPLSRPQRRLLLEALTGELYAEGRLTHFAPVLDTRGFAEGLLGTFEELQRAGAGSDSLAALGDGRTREVAELYARYRATLVLLGAIDFDGRLAHAVGLLHRQRRNPFASLTSVYVTGFTTFAPLEMQLLEQIATFVRHVWIALPDAGAGDERAELFATVRRTQEMLTALGAVPDPPPAATRVRGRGRRVSPNDAPLLALFDRRPAGLAHLEEHLFRPLRAIPTGDDAEGLLCLEGPGLAGEVRLVARRVKMLLLEGVEPGEVMLTARDLGPYLDLLEEAAAEYGIPLDLEGTSPLLAAPAIATLLRAARLPDDDWPFDGVTALLRSGHFRPRWLEARHNDTLPQHAEALLRLLGEPRDRAAYLHAVRRWALEQQAGLEDEQAEESRRRRTHELARLCAPFLERFFQAWDGAPERASLREHIAWLRAWAEDLGLDSIPPLRGGSSLQAAPEWRGPFSQSGSESELRTLTSDDLWQRWWDEIDHWLALDELRAARSGTRPALLDRRTFLRRLTLLAAETGVPRSPREPGRVRVLSAPAARHHAVEYRIILGMGERGFPDLSPPLSLLDDDARQCLRQTGLDLIPGDPLPGEMRLFHDLVRGTRKQLVLSYPAVDERGQDLLPGSFLHAVLDCFAPGVIPTERRRLLIEGLDTDQPLAPAELRVQAVRRGFAVPNRDLADHLRHAAELARERFGRGDFTVYDGLFHNPAIIALLRERFGSDRVFSPTALEDYIACPFRFFLGDVLRLEPLEEPREEIEVTRRGQAFHRALARLHRKLRAEGVNRPNEGVEQRVREQLEQAVNEDVARAPSPASKMLWQLEGERLLRLASRYRPHWEKFLAPWVEQKIHPEPYLFEADFGLPPADPLAAALPPLVLHDEAGDVRISGRIDRVDVAPLADGLGFWIIDYKTGRSEHYTSKAIQEFQRLQLLLYALAVEEVLLDGQQARPLGLAYWLVVENGPKVVLPVRQPVAWFTDAGKWEAVREQLREWVLTLVRHIRQGAFPLAPRREHCTETCPYGQICRITQARRVEKTWTLSLPIVA